MSEELLKAKEEEIRSLRQMVEDLKTEVRHGKSTSDRELIERELELLHDPYANQRALKIMGDVPPDDTYPAGQSLRWLNPRLREGRMKGWIYVKKDDPYIDQILPLIGDGDSNDKQYDNEDLDGFIRRKDLILGRLDKRIWDSRQARRELESMRQRGQYDKDIVEQLRPGVTMSGPGIQEDSTPRKVDTTEKTDGKGRTFLGLNTKKE